MSEQSQPYVVVEGRSLASPGSRKLLTAGSIIPGDMFTAKKLQELEAEGVVTKVHISAPIIESPSTDGDRSPKKLWDFDEAKLGDADLESLNTLAFERMQAHDRGSEFQPFQHVDHAKAVMSGRAKEPAEWAKN